MRRDALIDRHAAFYTLALRPLYAPLFMRSLCMPSLLPLFARKECGTLFAKH